MSAPKQLAKRKRLERKRLRKQKQSLKRKQKERQYRNSYADFLPDFDEPICLFGGPINGVKMSDVMNDFVSPMLDDVDSLAAYERLISMAQTAWNIAMEPERLRKAAVIQAVEKGMPSGSISERLWCRDFLEYLVNRKLEYFYSYNRRILAFHAEDLGDDEYYLIVMSSLE